MKPHKILQTLRAEKNQNGFTILEVLFAATVFLIGILALGALQMASIEGNATSRSVSEAANAALDQLESMYVQNYDDIEDGNVVSGQYTISWTVAEDADGVETKTVNMTVEWDDKETPRTLTFRQIIPLVDR